VELGHSNPGVGCTNTKRDLESPSTLDAPKPALDGRSTIDACSTISPRDSWQFSRTTNGKYWVLRLLSSGVGAITGYVSAGAKDAIAARIASDVVGKASNGNGNGIFERVIDGALSITVDAALRTGFTWEEVLEHVGGEEGLENIIWQGVMQSSITREKVMFYDVQGTYGTLGRSMFKFDERHERHDVVLYW
jgi:hypothetical protein